MPSSYSTVKFDPCIMRDESSKSRFDESLEVYRDLIRDPAFARIKAGGVLPRGTELILCPEIINIDGGFALSSIYYTDKNDKRVSRNAECWKIGNVRYSKWTQSRHIRKDQTKNKTKWHVPKLVYIQGRFAKEAFSPQNNPSPGECCNKPLIAAEDGRFYCQVCGWEGPWQEPPKPHIKTHEEELYDWYRWILKVDE